MKNAAWTSVILKTKSNKNIKNNIRYGFVFVQQIYSDDNILVAEIGLFLGHLCRSCDNMCFSVNEFWIIHNFLHV